jgi:plastocyanin
MRYNSIKNVTMTIRSYLSILMMGFATITSVVLTSSLFLLSETTWDNSIFVFATSQQQRNNITEVAAGGGNYSAPFTMYIPDKVEVMAGETVNWYNPTEVAEPHTVTFVMDNTTMAGVVSPLTVSNSTTFAALPPNSNNEPILIPGQDGTNTLMAVNARTYNPVAIDSSGNVEFMNPNANYTMDGTEKYVNSGWFVPEGMEQQLPGTGNTFSVTFEKPGTYNYLCILHPWMTGSITVR